MEKKIRKPLTPEQRAKKNAADRARRAAKKLGAPGIKKNKRRPGSKPPGRPHGKPKLRKLSEKSGKFVRPVKIKQHGITRPTPTDGKGKPRKTFRVWQIADEISAKTKQPATRSAVLKQCRKERITYSTFSNSFYSWRKFNGMRLRMKKDGKLSKPMGPGHGPGKKAKKPAKAKRSPKKKAAAKPVVKKPAAKKKATRKPALPVATSAPVIAVAPAVTPVPVADVGQAATPAPSAKPPLPGKPPLPAFMVPPPV